MKRLTNLLLALVLILSMSPAVHADIIYYPEDSFLEVHQEECTEVRRGFVARVDVTAYESPESDKVKGTIPEGENGFVYYTYTDPEGNEWGYIERFDPNVSGWVPMAYMQLRYDYISFGEDYGDQFTRLDVYHDLYQTVFGPEIHFWSYPGSESSYIGQIDADNLPVYNYTYTDPEDRAWAFVSYYMGHRNVWVCLSDPTADYDTLYSGNAPEVEITEPLPPLPGQEIKPSTDSSGVILGGIGAAACVLVTAAILLKRKARK